MVRHPRRIWRVTRGGLRLSWAECWPGARQEAVGNGLADHWAKQGAKLHPDADKADELAEKKAAGEEDSLLEVCLSGHTMFAELKATNIPIVAAIHGACLGGLCQCKPGWRGAACELRFSCARRSR